MIESGLASSCTAPSAALGVPMDVFQGSWTPQWVHSLTSLWLSVGDSVAPWTVVRSLGPFLHTFCASCYADCLCVTGDHQGCLSGSFTGVRAFGYLCFQPHPAPNICCHVSCSLLGALSAPLEVLPVWETSPSTTLEHSTVDHTSTGATHPAIECWF